MAERTSERRSAPPAEAAAPAVAIAGPHHAALAHSSDTLNRAAPVQRLATTASALNGAAPLPAQLRAGVEALSGIRMDDVAVHYNSSQPAQLNAHAYARGKDIHLGPGQERHLPHEAWHVVQQKQGRVKATQQLKAGVPVNDDKGLEHEADVMGARSLNAGSMASAAGASLTAGPAAEPGEAVVQGVFGWLWNLLGYPPAGGGGAPPGGGGDAPGGGGGAPGGGAPGGGAPGGGLTGPVVAPPVVVAPAVTPADLRNRLVAAENVYTHAAATLPAAIRQGWAVANEPAPVANAVQVVYGTVHGLVAFPPGGAAGVALAATVGVEGQANLYQAYCAAVRDKVTAACAMRAHYLDHLSMGDTANFTTIKNQVEGGVTAAGVTNQACDTFMAGVQVSSAQTSNGLHAMMMGPGNSRAQAEALVARYFAEGRLKINKWRIGYASAYDAKRLRFGAEWTLRAPDARLKDIADKWVFHTHAEADEARNFTISRAMGASHIKRIVDAHALGASLNFVDDAEFGRIENDAASKKAFEGWVNRSGGQSLRNTNKRT